MSELRKKPEMDGVPPCKRQRIENSGKNSSSEHSQGLNVFAIENKIMLRSEDHPSNLLEGLGELFRQGHLCDVVIRVEGQDFHAHRVVLAASSEFLRVLLDGGWKESQQTVVPLGGIDARSFRTILDFIYSGQVIASDVTELLHLLMASEQLQVRAVRELCIQRLQQRLDLPNALQMRIFAQQIGCLELESAASEVVWGQFSQVVAAGHDFLSLDEDQLSKILESDKLAVDSEEEVLYALMKWVNHDTSRIPSLSRLLMHVRLPMLPELVLDQLEKDELVAQVLSNNDENRHQFDEAKTYHRSQAICSPAAQRDPLSIPPSMRMRPPRVGKALFALGGRPAWTKVERYDPKLNEWSEVQQMRHKRMRHGSATLRGLIYVVGGKDESGRALSSVERYNPHTDEWEDLPPLQVPRTGVGVGTLAGMLYAVGGRQDSGAKSVECFNAQTGKWDFCVPMNEGRGALRVAALNGCLYVVGGRAEVGVVPVSLPDALTTTDNNGMAVRTVERYNPVEERWSVVAPMLTARVGAGLEVLGNHLYAIGGKDERGSKLRSVERYDPRRDQWSPVQPMGTKRWGAGVAVMDGKLYVIGGMNGAERGALPTVEVYDPLTDSWSELAPGPTLARGSCTFAAA